jgi:AraC-like DNA-binding protein
VALSDGNLYLDAGMHRAIEAILTCRYTGGLKKIFLLSKCMELLVMQAEAYNLSLGVKAGYVKTGYDKERLLYAREYLKQHVESPPSLPELSRILGINEYKLKKGFKELFGNTVFGYLADLRLDMARDYLLEKKKPASEIAFDLGYSSVQHFSTAFKNKFGVSPRAFSSPKHR